MPTIKILIATSCPTGQCHASYTNSLLKTFTYFQKVTAVKLKHKFILYDNSISSVRNKFVAYVLSDPSITHLLFIDPDIRWEPKDIQKLIINDKEMNGVPVAKKNYIWEKLRLSNVKELIMDDKLSPAEYGGKIQANIVDYQIRFGDSREVKGGIIEVEECGFNFMLIQRKVLEDLKEHYKELKVTKEMIGLDPEIKDYYYTLFEPSNICGEYLSEEANFCKRWAALNNKIFADLTINLGSYGMEEFAGNIMSIGLGKRG